MRIEREKSTIDCFKANHILKMIFLKKISTKIIEIWRREILGKSQKRAAWDSSFAHHLYIFRLFFDYPDFENLLQTEKHSLFFCCFLKSFDLIKRDCYFS